MTQELYRFYVVVIWGADNYNALGLLRQLGSSDLFLIFANTGSNNRCASVSKYCKKYVEIKVNEYAIDKLVELLPNTPKKGVLIPSGDITAEYVDKNSQKLLSFFHISGTRESGLLTAIDNKVIMNRLASNHGFNVPPFMLYTRNTSTISEEIVFPSIIKPIFSNNGIIEFKYKILRSIEELNRFRTLLNPKNTYILQTYIKKQKDILVYGVRLNNGRLILAGQFIKDRWSDDGGGSHGLLTSELPNGLNVDGIKTFLDEIDYRGLFSVEYGLNNDNYFFYEFNLRNDGTSHLFYQAGANLPLIWVFDCLGIPNNDISPRVNGIHWNINELYDIANVFSGNISLRRYIGDRKNADIFHFYDKDDLRPWKYSRIKALYDVPFRNFLKRTRPYIAYILNKIKI